MRLERPFLKKKLYIRHPLKKIILSGLQINRITSVSILSSNSVMPVLIYLPRVSKKKKNHNKKQPSTSSMIFLCLSHRAVLVGLFAIHPRYYSSAGCQNTERSYYKLVRFRRVFSGFLECSHYTMRF